MVAPNSPAINDRNRLNIAVIGRKGLTMMRKISLASASVLVASSLLAAAAFGADLRTACGSHPMQHAETIHSSHAVYTVQLGGSIDGPMTRDPLGYWAYVQYWEPNVSVTLANTGDVPVVNPWLRRSDMPDTRTLKSLVDSIVKPGMSDKEKARALWEWEIHHRFHATSQDAEVQDVVKNVNAYGYGLCYDESREMNDLWGAAGLKTRKGFPNGHSLTEVFYDGAWHVLDSDESIISLLRNNETIASLPQIVADHDLMKRTHTYGVLAPDSRMTDEGSAALIGYLGKRGATRPNLTRHTMDFTLRPGESITWAWNPANRYHAAQYPSDPNSMDMNQWNKRWQVIAHVMDGNTVYDPDFSKAPDLKYLETQGVEYRHPGKFGDGLYLTGKTGTVDVPIKTAYPIVGGRLIVDFSRQDIVHMDDELAVSISFDGGKKFEPVQSTFPSEFNRMIVDLDPVFPRTGPARYDYILRFTLSNKSGIPGMALKGFDLRSTLQMAQLAMPGLVLGQNNFIYTDDTAGPHTVMITRNWNQCEAQIPIPAAPQGLTPSDGSKVSGTKVRFHWNPGSAVAPADYEFVLSESPDMRWPLSPNFHKLISRTANRGTSTFVLPYAGLLNPGQKYYWHVRARSEQGVWGPWSQTVSFSAVAPAVPIGVKTNFDSGSRTVQLSWQRGGNGTSPVHYRIYGSEEKGFTAHDHPYKYNAGPKGVQQFPANLLTETKNANLSIQLPPSLWRPYYRVVAVDSDGRVSGPSAQAGLTHPLISATKLPLAIRNRFYRAKVSTSASIGDLVSETIHGMAYQMAFRQGDTLSYQMTGAPQGLSISNEGVISGYVGAASKNKYDLMINVADKTSGKSDSVVLVLPVGDHD